LGINNAEDQEALVQALKKAGGQPEKMLEDPNVRRIVGEAADKLEKDRSLTDEDRQRYKEYARRFLPSTAPTPPDPTQPDPPGTNPDGSPPAKPPDPTKPPEGTKPPSVAPPPEVGGSTIPIEPQPPPSPPSLPQKSPMNERLRDIAESLADSGLADSPAFRRMIMNLDRVKAPEAPGIGRWNGRLDQFEDRFIRLGNRLPNLSLRKLDFSRRDPGGRVIPPSADPTAATGSASQTVFVMLAAAAVGLLAWGLLRRQGLLVLRRADGSGWRLGPWPVRPEAVRTRDELVRAFEYLALLLLGPAARSRNHREIAAGLGEHSMAHEAAAERLAGLYEQARYAPPHDPLPDADLAAARADLCLLAGVAAA
jgi:hypothetical protein